MHDPSVLARLQVAASVAPEPSEELALDMGVEHGTDQDKGHVPAIPVQEEAVVPCKHGLIALDRTTS